MKLLKQLCSIHAPSGSEETMTRFVLDYINKNKKNWKVKPRILHGDPFQDCILLVFGKPRTAVFAHMDSIGFTARYKNGLVKIGGPKTENGYKLVGKDSKGAVEAKLKVDKKGNLSCNYKREIERGTTLTFKPNFRESKEYIQSCYLDNRLGVWIALKLAETLENGVIAFSCWEEHGGGSVEYLGKFLYDEHGVQQALIADITWVTEGVEHGKGAAISIRDSGIPRRGYVDKVIRIAKKSGVPFQLEVEGAGGSDGQALQRSPYPWDWCFVGAPEANVHTPDEKVHKKDIESMLNLYKVLMKEL